MRVKNMYYKIETSDIIKVRNNSMFQDYQITGYKLIHHVISSSIEIQIDYSLDYAYSKFTTYREKPTINYNIAKYSIKIHLITIHKLKSERSFTFSTDNWKFKKPATMENFNYTISNDKLYGELLTFLQEHYYDNEDVQLLLDLFKFYLQHRNVAQIYKLFIIQDGL